MAGIHRRHFLQAAGIGAGAAALSCLGLVYLAVRPPAADVEFYEHSAEQKEAGMGRVLIAYASKLGSTGEVARAVAEELAARGCAADVRRAGDAADLSAYQAVLVGSAVRRGRRLPEAADFLERQTGQPKAGTVSYFTVCMTMAEDTPENRAKAGECSADARAVCAPAAEAFFAGRMEYGRVSFAEQLILRAMGVPEGDFRDWDAVRAWASRVPIG